MARKKDIQDHLNDFIGWMEKDGMLGRWERQGKIDEVRRSRRCLNRKIRERRAIIETLNNL